MGFSLADIFVTIGADSAPFNRAIDGVKKSIQATKPHFEALASASRKVFLGLAGIGAGAVAAFAEAESQEAELRAALSATGQEVDQNMAKFNAFATTLSRVTTMDDDAAKSLMAFATNLGITADKLEAVTEGGIGLGRVMGTDAKSGTEAYAKALQGNFRALEKMFPAIKNASTAQEKWAIVQKMAASGFKQEQDLTKTTTGQLKQLWNEVGNVAEGFGEILAPALGKAIGFMKALAIRLQSLTPEQKKQIVTWGLYAAGIAAVIGFGPIIVGFGATVVSAFMAIGGAILAVGTAIVTGLFTPFGIVIAGVVAGLAAAVTGFAYFAGAGETAGGKIIDGFKRVWDFLKFVFQNSSSLSEAVAVAWGGIGFIISDAWENAKAAMFSKWEEIKTGFRAVWEMLQHIVTDAVISATEFFVNAWDTAMSAHRAAVKATGDFFTDTWISAQEQVGAITKKEADEKRAYLAQMRGEESKADAQADAEKAAAKKKFFDDMHKLEKEQNEKNLGGVVDDERTNKAKIEADRKAQVDANAKGAQAFKDQQAENFKKSGKESLSDQIESLYEKAKKGLGVDDLLKMVDQLKGEADKLKNQSAEELKKLDYEGGEKSKKGKKEKEHKTQDVESAFKEDLVRSVGSAMADQGEAADRRELKEIQKRQTAELVKAATGINKLVKGRAVFALG